MNGVFLVLMNRHNPMIKKWIDFFECTIRFPIDLKIAALKIVLLFLICFSASNVHSQQEEKITTIIIVRHAEKLNEANNSDPGLSEKGKKRAQNYADLFKEEMIHGIYATSYQRTKQTLEPLATVQGLTVKEYAPVDEKAFAAIFKEHEGGRIMICGHSNTVPVLLKYFVPSEDHSNLEEDEYDKVFIISKASSGETSLLKLTIN